MIEDMRIESQHTHAQGSLSAEFGGQLAGQVVRLWRSHS